MKRKVIQIAGSTQLVSLPRKWALQNKIMKGDELDVIEQGTQLSIRVNSEHSRELIGELNFSSVKKYLRRPLTIFYKLGYTEVIITFSDVKIVSLINEQVQELLGFEVVSQSNNRCIVKNVAEPIHTEFKGILRRLFLTVISTCKESSTALRTNNYDTLNNIFLMEKTINKLSLFCERLLNTKGYIIREKTCFVYKITTMLEEIGDYVKNLTKFITSNKIKVKEDLINLFDEIVELLDCCYELFYKYDMDKLVKFKIKQQKIDKKIKKFFDLRHNGFVVHNIYSINETLRKLTLFLN